MPEPIICFGQQPAGIFPKRFLFSKIQSARELQKQIGGKIVFFYHDSDHDYRETITVMPDLRTGKIARLNFTQENQVQKKYSPLYAKRIPSGWKQETLKQLPRFVNKELFELFQSVEATTAGEFCLQMYHKLGLLKGIEVVRSGDPGVREAAIELKDEFFADVPYENEIVRARWQTGALRLHAGGHKYIDLPKQTIKKGQKNPARDQRFLWMQSVVNSTHYILGGSEAEYLKLFDFPEVNFVKRQEIEQSDMAWLPG